MNAKIKILVATHKPISAIQNKIFQPIQVGKSLNDFIISDTYILDNNNTNISIKNKTFNELTALYWAWKNNYDCEIIGLAHYRRFLDIFHKIPFFKKDVIDIIKPINVSNKNLKKLNDVEKTKDKIRKLLKDNDIIVPKPAFCTVNEEFASVSKDYKHNHIESDWIICMNVIIEKYPAYKPSIDKYLESENKFYIGNMFITSKKLFDNYCDWLFDILFEVEKRIVPSSDPYQNRVIGFLSERLFTLYILHNKLKLKQLPILFIEDIK